MPTNRRDFLKTGAVATLGLTLPFTGQSSSLLNGFGANRKIKDFGIQLWTVKEDMGKDAKGTLAKLAQYGFEHIESFEGQKGIFWGMNHKEFKKYMDDLDMKIVSAHCNNTVEFERKAAEAGEIGMKYLICPYKGAQKSMDDYKRFADEFNKCGEICKKNGLRFAYHNHDYSFKPMNGQMPQDVMMQGTDKDLVDYEMDIYWVVAAGEDPRSWFIKYPNRFRLCHIKDLVKTADGKHESVQVGKGSIDFKSVLKTGRDNGLKCYIVEQEAFTGTNPLDSAQANAAFMNTFNM